MSGDHQIDQLLARAILDMELKIKHEMRQNSALVMAKMEKNHQQVEKRLTIMEAKLEAMINRDGGVSRGGGGYQQQQRGTYPGSAGRTTSYYARTANLTSGGHSHNNIRGGIQRGSAPHSRIHSMGSPGPAGQTYGAFGGDGIGTPTAHRHQHQSTTIHHKASGGGLAVGKQHIRPKTQTLGTGGNKAQLGEKMPTTTPVHWTAKMGLYTDDDDEDGSSDSDKSRSDSDPEKPAFSVAKPSLLAPSDIMKEEAEEEEEDEEEQDDEDEDNDEETEVDVKEDEDAELKNKEEAVEGDKKEKFAVGEEEEDESEEEAETLVNIVIKAGKKHQQLAEEKENKENVSEAPIPDVVIGGFGRGRRN